MAEAGLLALLVLLGSSASPTASAAQVSYSFETGPLLVAPVGSPLASMLGGMSVTGSFGYDSDTPVTGTLPNGGSYYLGALSDLQGSIGSWSFSDSLGLASAENDALSLPAVPFPVDLLMLSAEPMGYETTENFSGFGVSGLALINVRLFWMETFVGGAGDFLDSNDLPSALPGGSGRLALDFRGSDGAVSYAFFDGLRVTAQPHSVPEPGTLALLGVGLAGLGLVRRRCAS